MVKTKVLKVNIKTGKEEIVEEDITLPTPAPLPEQINFDDIKKLIDYAKKMGWI